MKQKRKVKTLLSGKEGLKDRMFVSLLIILGGVLILVSSGIMMRTVSAEPDVQPGNKSKIGYKGVNDRVEVLENLSFIDKDLKNDLYNVYEQNKNLYITSRNVIVNDKLRAGSVIINHGTETENTVENGKYGHILGGTTNTISGNNVTIIAGSENVIGEKNDNSVILGGVKNIMLSRSLKELKELLMLGGEANRMETPDGLAGIIGGKSNILEESAESATILGGSENVVNGTNTIVGGGHKVTANDTITDVFVFSNKNEFEIANNDEQGKTFYLNVENGLGINKSAESKGVDAKGAVGFGNIDINTKCDENNYGVQGIWELEVGGEKVGCLVGCTKKSKEDQGKWEMLDSSDSCKDACKKGNNKCVTLEGYKPTTVDGSCEGNFHMQHTNRCDELGSERIYKDTVFQNVLIERCSQMESMGLKDNRCVYECVENAILTEDKVNIPGRESNGYGCYLDCVGEWGTLHHGEETDLYNNTGTSCANDDNDPKSPHTCRDHMARVICVDGTLHYKNGTVNNNHIHPNCNLNGYHGCENLGYKLTKLDITGGQFPDSVSWNSVDRDVSSGQRGNYRLCVDFDGQSVTHSNESCRKNKYYYKAECNDSDHYTEVNGLCAKQCRFDGDGMWHNHGDKIDLRLKAEKPICPLTCGETTEVTCNDGDWEVGGSKVDDINNYETTDQCKVVEQPCDGYGIDKQFLDRLTEAKIRSGTRYFSCQKYGTDGDQSCIEGDEMYKFDDCNDGYHKEKTLGMYNGVVLGQSIDSEGNWKYCVPNDKAVQCKQEGKPDHSEYIVKDVQANWNVDTNDWEVPNCEWKCEDKFEENSSGGCDMIVGACKGKLADNAVPNNDNSPMGEREKEYEYEDVDVDEPCTFQCKENYTWNGSECVADKREVECGGSIGENMRKVYGTEDRYTQIWNGEEWQPEYEWSITNTLVCGVTCDDAAGYDWQGGSCEPQSCSALTTTYGDCSYNILALGHSEGQTVSTYTQGYKGSITARCDKGNWVYSNQSCDAQGCDAETKSYGNCSYSIPALGNGGSQTINTNTQGYAGSVTATCDKGNLNYSNESCTEQACSQTTRNNGDCSYSIPALGNGETKTVSTNTAGYAGSTTAKCDKGTLKYSDETCTVKSCQEMTRKNGNCSYSIPALGNGETQTVSTSTAGYAGSTTATCDKGTLKYSGESCEQQKGCSATTKKNGNCSYSIPALKHLEGQTVNTNTQGYAGSIKVSCDNGTLKYSDESCVPQACSATTRKNGNCSYSIPALGNGETQTINTNTQGYAGSTTVSCNAGNLSYSNESCGPTSCSATTKINGNCSYSIPALSNGETKIVNTSTAGYVGSTTAKCDNGTLKYSDESCESPKGCGLTTRNNGDCSYSIPALSNGETKTVSTSTQGYDGSVSVKCSDGNLSYSNESCKAKSCSQASTIYGDCSYSIPALGNGESQVVNTNTIGFEGNVMAKCDKGTLSYSNQSCNLIPKGCIAKTEKYGDCSYSVPELSHGENKTVNTSTDGYAGSIVAACNNGNLTISNKNCTKQSCTAKTEKYGDCSYSIPALGDGKSQTVNTSTQGYNGSITAKCDKGTLNFSNRSCSEKKCKAETTTYGSCSYSISEKSDLEIQTVNTSTQGYKGSITAKCDKGERIYSNQSCEVKSCTAETKSYGNCSYSIPALSNGETQTLNTATQGYNGSITAKCDKGELTYSNQSCNPKSCEKFTKTYGNCSYSIPVLSNGENKTVSTSTKGYEGNVIAKCDKGTLSFSNESCNAIKCKTTTRKYGDCDYDIPELLDGGNQSINTKTSGYVGSTTATCNGGTLTFSNESCKAKSCESATKTYGNCSYSIPALSNGGSQTVSTSTQGYNGSITAKCDKGTLSYSNESCKLIPKNCTAKTEKYGDCSYSVPELKHGENKTVNTSTAGYAGSVTAKCDDGNLTISNQSCTKQSCGSTTEKYENCSYSIPALSNGGSQTVSTSTQGYNGSITAKCDKGTLTFSNKSCSEKSCENTTTSYLNCSYDIPALGHGKNTTILTSTSGYTGYVTAKCDKGSRSFSDKSCLEKPCLSTTKQSGNCSYSIPMLPNGSSKTVSTFTQGYNGNVTATCDKGTRNYSNESCTPKPCSSTTTSYGSCSYSIPALSNGGSKTVSTSTQGYNGNITATCDKGTLTFSNKSCSEKSCGATTGSYSNCLYDIPALGHGKSQTVVNNASGYSGNITAKCDKGTLKYSNGYCVPKPCNSTTTSYLNCSYSIPVLGHGGEEVVDTKTSGYAGSVKAKCSYGVLTFSNKSCDAKGCGSTTTSYGNCSYDIPALGNGKSSTKNTTTSGYSGSITATCDKGTLTFSSKSCGPKSCSSTTTSYGTCSFNIPALSSGSSKIITVGSGTDKGSITATCSYGTLSYTNKSCQHSQNCTGKPNDAFWSNGKFIQIWGGSSWSSQSPAKCVKSSSTDECTYTCPSKKTCNSTYTDCRWIVNGECDTEKYKCIEGDSINNGDDGTKFTWNCKGEDDTGDGAKCDLECPSGKVMKNHECVDIGPCLAPTITGVDGRNVSFVLNGADASATMLIISEDNKNRPSGGSVSGTGSPRPIGSTPAKGYVKMRTLCKGNVWSDDSNIVEFADKPSYPDMIIDKVKDCKVYYHFNGNDPISGKTCCTDARLDYSYNNSTWGPLTTTYGSPLSLGLNGKSGLVYFRYSLDSGKSWSSTVSYDMPKQSCCKTTKLDWNGKPFDWTAGTIYDSNKNAYEVDYRITYYVTYWPNGDNKYTTTVGTTKDVNQEETNGLIVSECGKLGGTQAIAGHVSQSCTMIVYYPNYTVKGYIPSMDNQWQYVEMVNGEVITEKNHGIANLVDCI